MIDINPNRQRAKQNEYHTPLKYITEVKNVLGYIDLDPASSYLANETIGADNFYSVEENGLAEYWHGTIFLNPPFSDQQAWTEKLLDEFCYGSVDEAVLLCQAATERKWFKPLWHYPICFLDHQLIFDRPDGKSGHIYHGCCFVYLGPDTEKFRKHFKQFGTIINSNDYPFNLAT